MSVERTDLEEDAARKEAERVLRKDIGNLPYLGDPELNEGVFVFPLKIRLPRVIFDEESQEPVNVRFLGEAEIGEISIDAQTSEYVDRTNISTIERRIRTKKKEVDVAVQKALIKGSAEQFSVLPFPEHRYTPILDLLSEVILAGQIERSDFEEMGIGNRENYMSYVETLESANLIRWEDDRLTAADPLIEIEARTETPHDALNAGLAHFFKEGTDNFEMIKEVMKPYLVIAGFYYRRAIESEQMPNISSREFREELRSRYTGKDGELKAFKLSRYLLQLEEVGILNSNSNRSGRVWTGEDEVLQNLLMQEEELEPIANVVTGVQS